MFDLAQVNVLDAEGDYDNLAFGPDIHWPTISQTGFPSENPSIKQQLITFGIGSGGTLLNALAAKISGGLVGPSPENLQILFGANRYALPGAQPNYQGTGAGSDIGATAGHALGGIGDAVGKIVTEHPYMTIVGGVCLVLWFMPSPSRGIAKSKGV